MIDVSFTPFPFLTTENYALRNLKPEDEQEIFVLRSSDEINKYLDRPKANTLDDAQSFCGSQADYLPLITVPHCGLAPSQAAVDIYI